ncbi:hypothetical protein [Mesorhizobium loti]
MHQGRTCMSTGRPTVDEKITDRFVSKLAARASQR